MTSRPYDSRFLFNTGGGSYCWGKAGIYEDMKGRTSKKGEETKEEYNLWRRRRRRKTKSRRRKRRKWRSKRRRT